MCPTMVSIKGATLWRIWGLLSHTMPMSDKTHKPAPVKDKNFDNYTHINCLCIDIAIEWKWCTYKTLLANLVTYFEVLMWFCIVLLLFLHQHPFRMAYPFNLLPSIWARNFYFLIYFCCPWQASHYHTYQPSSIHTQQSATLRWAAIASTPSCSNDFSVSTVLLSFSELAGLQHLLIWYSPVAPHWTYTVVYSCTS